MVKLTNSPSLPWIIQLFVYLMSIIYIFKQIVNIFLCGCFLHIWYKHLKENKKNPCLADYKDF